MLTGRISTSNAFGRVALFLGAFTTLLTLGNLNTLLPYDRWLDLLRFDDLVSSSELLFVWSALPRISVAILSGAALSLAGVIFQQCLRNPMAEATTLGTSAGAQTALLVALVWIPSGMGAGQGPVAVAGGLLGTLLVFGISGRSSRSPVSIIMAGLVVNLTLGTLCAIIVLLFPERTEDLLQWQTGRLEQSSWGPAVSLLICLLVCLIAVRLIFRALSLLDVSDEVASSLGLSPSLVRATSLFLAIIMAGSVVASVGMISFVGLAVPALARALGARTLKQRLFYSPILGALLLLLADQIVQISVIGAGQLPTGVFASLLGAPVLLFLLNRIPRTIPQLALQSSRNCWKLSDTNSLFIICAAFLFLLPACLFIGRGPAGWEWADWDLVMQWRAGRALAAVSAGILLAIAGTLIQRVTNNPMASPEVIGISAGATLGAIVLAVSTAALTAGNLLAASTAGALAVTCAIMFLGWKGNFSSERILLAGIALTTIVGAISSFMISAGGPVRGLMLTWMSGSTYRVTDEQAMLVSAIALLTVLLTPLLHRWLDILPLGDDHTRSLGVSLRGSRGIIVAGCSLATAAATLVVGPATFVGLLAPHLVLLFGFRRALPQLAASAMAGASIMLVADWLGRVLIFPWQIPAGLLTALIGGPVFLFSMMRKR